MASVYGAGMTSALAEQGLWYGRLCTSSSSAIILYDHLITLGNEVHLIWRSRWSAGKALFLISRYYNVFTVIFNTSSVYFFKLPMPIFMIVDFYYQSYIPQLLLLACFAWLRWQAVSGIFVYGITEIILMLRLYAMYSSSRRILALLIGGFTTVIIAEIVILVFSTRAQIGTVNADPHLLLPMSTCILTDTWRLSYLYWIPFLVFEFVLFILALAKGIQSVRDHELELDAGVIGLCSSGRGRAAKALEVLIRDSILYFMLIFAIFLVNALAWIVENGRIGEIPVALAVALSTVMAQRLLLNIRENFERRRAGVDADESTAAGSDTFALSTIAFDELCLVSQSDQGAGRRPTGRTAVTGSTLSGSTVFSPVSPIAANATGKFRETSADLAPEHQENQNTEYTSRAERRLESQQNETSRRDNHHADTGSSCTLTLSPDFPPV